MEFEMIIVKNHQYLPSLFMWEGSGYSKNEKSKENKVSFDDFYFEDKF